MARQYMPLYLSIWQNADFIGLDASPQRTYFVACSQPSMTYCGVVPFQPGSWSALAKNTTAPRIRKDVEDLAAKRFVVLDKRTEELWARSFMRHAKVFEQPNLIKAMKASYEHIRSLAIKQSVYDAVPADLRSGMTNPFPTDGNGKGITEGFPEGLAEPIGNGLSGSQGLGLRESVVKGLDLDLEPESEPSPEPSPPPEPEPVAPTAPSDGQHDSAATASEAPENGSHQAQQRRVFGWTDRAMDLFGFPNRKHIPTQRVMALACAALDDRLLDECLRYCAGRAETDPIQHPKYLHRALHNWAKDRGILIPPPLEAAS